MPQNLFQVSTIDSAHVVDLSLPTSLDSGEFDVINEALKDLVSTEPAGGWVFDLSQLTYMGSAALGLLVNLRQQVKQGGGRVALCGLSPRLVQIFRTCCMERLFVIKPGRAEAMRAVGR
jgi:anti-sigma B factor antagonist